LTNLNDHKHFNNFTQISAFWFPSFTNEFSGCLIQLFAVLNTYKRKQVIFIFIYIFFQDQVTQEPHRHSALEHPKATAGKNIKRTTFRQTKPTTLYTT
jgi:hypothetical protein